MNFHHFLSKILKNQSVTGGETGRKMDGRTDNVKKVYPLYIFWYFWINELFLGSFKYIQDLLNVALIITKFWICIDKVKMYAGIASVPIFANIFFLLPKNLLFRTYLLSLFSGQYNMCLNLLWWQASWCRHLHRPFSSQLMPSNTKKPSQSSEVSQFAFWSETEPIIMEDFFGGISTIILI